MLTRIEKVNSPIDMSLITIKNDVNFEVQFLSYGAAIYSISYPNRNGEVSKVAASCKDLTAFAETGNCYGKTIGPVAGRIKDATAKIGNEVYNFEKNEKGVTVLHSGSANTAYKNWNFELKTNLDKVDLIFTTKTKHLEGGFPGNIDYKVTFTIPSNKKEINAKFYARPDRPAFISMTNHIYFNLNGGVDKIFDQELYVRDYKVADLDDKLIIQKFVDAPIYLDYSTPSKLGTKITHEKLMKHATRGMDHPFKFNEINKTKPCATLSDPVSKRKVSIYTTFPGIVIYGDNWPDNLETQGGVKDTGNFGLAMETEIVTNDPKEFTFTKENPFNFVTKYKFN